MLTRLYSSAPISHLRPWIYFNKATEQFTLLNITLQTEMHLLIYWGGIESGTWLHLQGQRGTVESIGTFVDVQRCNSYQ